MLKIALCDDEMEQQNMMALLTAEYFNGNANLKMYSDGQKLLDIVDWNGPDVFDLYILDIIMPEMSGIQLGNALRDRGVSAPIVYITTSKDFAVDSYSVQAFHYLVKPVDREQLFTVLARAEKIIEKNKADTITVNTASGTVIISVSDILYAELYSRAARYRLFDGTIIDSLKLHTSFRNAVAQLLSSISFKMLGSSFAVNLHHIKEIQKKELIFVNGATLSIPKGAKNNILRAWMDYWMERNVHRQTDNNEGLPH